jgi:hypothetical protein
MRRMSILELAGIEGFTGDRAIVLALALAIGLHRTMGTLA